MHEDPMLSAMSAEGFSKHFEKYTWYQANQHLLGKRTKRTVPRYSDRIILKGLFLRQKNKKTVAFWEYHLSIWSLKLNDLIDFVKAHGQEMLTVANLMNRKIWRFFLPIYQIIIYSFGKNEKSDDCKNLRIVKTSSLTLTLIEINLS